MQWKYKIWCLLVLAVAECAECVNVTAISPSSGSILGGTLVTIEGNDFDIRGRSNLVYIGDGVSGTYCDPQPDLCSTSRIVCLTDKFAGRGPFDLTVVANGIQAECAVAGGCRFAYSYESTPEITKVRPEWITAPGELTIRGNRLAGAAQADVQILIGEEERCEFGSFTTEDYLQCTVHTMFPGTLGLSVRLSQAGNAIGDYNLNLVPLISQVYPTEGSTAGGQLLSVYGSGFSSVVNENSVTVQGAACHVTTVHEGYMECITSPHLPASSRTVNYQNGVVLAEYWPNVGPGSIYEDLAQTQLWNSPVLTRTTTQFGGYMPFPTGASTATRFTALFVATVPGYYTFYIKSNGAGELWLSDNDRAVEYENTTVVSTDPFNANRIAFTDAPASTFDVFSTQKSAAIWLNYAEERWIRAYTKGEQGESGFGLRITNPLGGNVTNPTGSYFKQRTANEPVVVTVRGNTALYTNNCTGASGLYSYSAASTPSITSVSPFPDIVPGSNLTVTGSFLKQDASQFVVSVGDYPCTVLEANSSRIVCAAPEPAAGTHNLQLYVRGLGYATGTFSLKSSLQITSVRPLSGSIYGGTLVTIRGTGFGNTADFVQVSVGGAACAVSTVSNQMITCVTGNYGSENTAAVMVTIKTDLQMRLGTSFTYIQALVRPGTTHEPASPSFSPTNGSFGGNTMLYVRLPALHITSLSDVTVSIAGNPCPVVTFYDAMLVCRTPPSGTIGPANVSYTYSGTTTVIGAFEYSGGVTSISYTASDGPQGTGGVVDLTLNIPQPRLTELIVSVGGSSCSQLYLKSRYVVECVRAAPSNQTLPTLASHETFSTTNFSQFFVSSNVTVVNGALQIPAGAFVFTRRQFDRPVSIRATITPTEAYTKATASCIHMRALVADPTSLGTGYSAHAGTTGARFGLEDGYTDLGGVQEFTSVLASIGLEAGEPMEWQLDIALNSVTFFVNGVRVQQINSNDNWQSGAVGFSGSCQTIRLKSLTVRDLQPLVVQVNQSGHLVSNRFDIPYITSTVEVLGISTDKLTGNSQFIIFMSDSCWGVTVYALTSPTELVTPSTLRLCSSTNVQGTYVYCTVSTEVPAGNYSLKVMLYNGGFRAFRAPISVTPTITAVAPSSMCTNGGLVTIAGYNFPSAGLAITVESQPCQIWWVDPLRVVCLITSLASFGGTVAVSYKSVTLPCPLALCTITSNPPPTVTSVTPAQVVAGMMLTIGGTSFSSNVRVYLNTIPCQVRSASSTTIYCQLTPPFSSVGTFQLNVYVAEYGRATATGMTVQILSWSMLGPVTPNYGSIKGGSMLTMSSSLISLLGSARSVVFKESYTYTPTDDPSQWNGFGLYTSCPQPFGRMLGGYNALGGDDVLTRNITTTWTHAWMWVQASIALIGQWGNEELYVTIDGVRHVFTTADQQCYDVLCGGQRKACLITINFCAPHNKYTANVSLSTSARFGYARSWGVLYFNLTAVLKEFWVVTSDTDVYPIYELHEHKVVVLSPIFSAPGTSTLYVRYNNALQGCMACNYTAAPEYTPTISGVGVIRMSSDRNWLQWINVEKVAAVNGTTAQIVKTDATAGWNAGAASLDNIYKGYFNGISFSFSAECSSAAFGFSAKDSSFSYENLDFAFLLSSGTLYIMESGVTVKSLGSYPPQAVLSIRCNDVALCSNMHYFVDDQLVHVSWSQINFPLRIDSSIHTPSCRIYNIVKMPTTQDSPFVPLLIAGTQLSSVSFVTINGVNQSVIHSFSGSTIVDAPAAAAALWQTVEVRLYDSRGWSAIQNFVIAPSVLQASHLRGGVAAGRPITITGAGFNPTATTVANFITQAVTTSSIVMDFNSGLTADNDRPINVAVNSVPAVCLFNVCPVYHCVAALQPTTSSCDTTAIPGQCSTFTVTGSNFVEGELGEILFGSVAAPMTSSTNGYAKCLVPTTLLSGVYAVKVRYSSGASWGDVSTTVPLSVDAFPSLLVGTLGAARITLTGYGFGMSGDAATPVGLFLEGAPACSTVSRSGLSFVCTTVAFSKINSSAPLSLVVGSATTVVSWLHFNPVMVPAVFPPSTPAAQGDVLMLRGLLMSASMEVTVGPSRCVAVTLIASDKISCIIESPLPFGWNVLDVVSPTYGRATCVGNITSAFRVLKVVPEAIPEAGGAVEIIVNGLDPSLTYNVAFGSALATGVTTSGNSIRCTAPAATSFVGAFLDVVVSNAAALSASNASYVYSYSLGMTVTISDVQPRSGSASGYTYVTITGSGFDSLPLNDAVMIGSTPCDVISVSALMDSIVCLTRPFVGAFTGSTPSSVTVTVAGKGNGVAASAKFTFILQVDSVVVDGVAPSGISVEGGVRLTLAGQGFASAIQYTEVMVGGVNCTVQSVTDTQIQCVVDPAPRETPKRPPLSNVYTLRNGGTYATKVTVRGVAAVVSGGSVTFSPALTPRIASVSNTNGTVENNTVIEIRGSGFAASGNKVTLILPLTGATSLCTVVTETTTSITCSIVANSYGLHFVTVYVPGVGLAYSPRSCPTGQYLTCDGRCLRDSDCAYAQWGVEGCTDLADIIIHDTFCHSNGGLDSINKPFLTDTKVPFITNCPLYGCEGGDCNTVLTIGGQGARVSTCGDDPNGFMVDIRPRVTAVSHKASSINGGLRITIQGQSLGADSQIKIGSALCVVLQSSTTSLVCETSAAAAALGLTMTLTRDTGVALCAEGVCTGFSYSPVVTPVVTDIAYSPVDSPLVTLFGVGFSATSANDVVTVGGYACAVTNASTSVIKCTPPDLTPGSSLVAVRIAGTGLATMSSAKAITIVPYVTSISPSSGSSAGGTIVTIIAFGINPSSVTVTIGCATTLLEAVKGRIVVKTGSCSGNRTTSIASDSSVSPACRACTFQYSSVAPLAPQIQRVTLLGLGGAIEGNFVVSDSAAVKIELGDATCSISTYTTAAVQFTCPSAHLAGTYPIRMLVTPLGYAVGETKSLTYGLQVTGVSPISGSLGGGQTITISGEGFGSSAANIVVRIGGLPCTVLTAAGAYVTCQTSSTRTAFSATANVSIVQSGSVIASAASSALYSFSDALTPRVTSVSPNRGSTAGGTMLTITGSGFNVDDRVTIGGRACIQSTQDRTQFQSTAYYCTTAASSVTTESVDITLTSATGNGNALIDSGKYQFVDLWSRKTTWGGDLPPVAGDSVVVSEGQTVMLDVSPPKLYLIIVMGHLMFDDTKNLTLECTYIMVNFGRLTIGTLEKPFRNLATVRLYGNRLTPEIPVHGAKVIAVRNGAIDIHGIPRYPTWTKLAATAGEGTNVVHVSGPVDWVAGESIVVASTDFDMEHAEKRVIISVANASTLDAVITLDTPLNYQHFGVVQCYGTPSVCVDERAEVALLTRNVVIEGDEDSERLGFGAVMYLMPLGHSDTRHVKLSHLELRRVGQRFITGRHPVLLHLSGEITNSYVQGLSIHDSLNRGIVLRGVSNATISDNVVYNVQGHGVALEEGSERFNTLRHNVVMVVRTSTTGMNSDITPAAFFASNPQNYFDGNSAAGSATYGFWVCPSYPHSTGASASLSDCPWTAQLGSFQSNVAHGSGRYGVNVFRIWQPKAVECAQDDADAPATLRGNTVFKNRVHGISLAHSEVGVVGAVQVDRLTSADNGEDQEDSAGFWIEHIDAPNMTCGISNSVFVASTSNQPYVRTARRRGINLPESDNFFARNITFVNYNRENFAIEPMAWADRFSLDHPWAWESVFSGLAWYNSTNRVLFRFPHHGILNDEDGTLGGLPNSQVVPIADIYNASKCIGSPIVSTVYPAAVCPPDYKIRRFGVYTVSAVFGDHVWTVDNRSETVYDIHHEYLTTAPINKVVTLDFGHATSPETWTLPFNQRYMDPSERELFSITFRDYREKVTATFDGVLDELNSTKYGTPTLDTPESAYNYNMTTHELTLLMREYTSKTSVTALTCLGEDCILPPYDPPVDKPCEPWSRNTSWINGVPSFNVTITRNDSICP